MKYTVKRIASKQSKRIKKTQQSIESVLCIVSR